MNNKFFGILLFTLSTIAVAENITVYRWVDENDIVHFSQNQPAHDNYTELTLLNNAKHQSKSAKPTTVTNPLAATASSAVSAEAPVDSSASLCENAKANLKTLTEFDNIQYTDAKGELRVLTDLEKSQQLSINEKQVEVYCANQ